MQIQRFNLETMSGVFPGVRTQVFQRILLWPSDSAPLAAAPGGDETSGGVWAQLFWYETPRACVLQVPSGAPAAEAAGDAPLLRIEAPQPAAIIPELETALREWGWQMRACGNCRFWRAVDGAAAATVDGIPLGVCQWQDEHGRADGTEWLAQQSALALGCERWAQAPPDTPRHESTDTQIAVDEAVPAVAKDAEAEEPEEEPEAPSSFWGRLRDIWARFVGGDAPGGESASRPSLAERIQERSGVGAGTEACFACQGRMANLNALVVESPEGDKQTLSVWRCRLCHTYYLNNWIDRWERLDNLETEEAYYRVAPAEALCLLRRMEAVPGGEHPRKRMARGEQRAWFAQFMQERQPLSHQVKQGR
jgi:hypothetical protein